MKNAEYFCIMSPIFVLQDVKEQDLLFTFFQNLPLKTIADVAPMTPKKGE